MAGRLRQARKDNGISQADLRDKSGLSIERIRILEKNKGRPNGDEIISLCHSLDISPNWYLYGTDSLKHVKYIQSNLIGQNGLVDDSGQVVRLAFIFSVLTPEERRSLEIILTSMLRGSGRDSEDIESLLNIADTLTTAFTNSPLLNNAIDELLHNPEFREVLASRLSQDNSEDS